MKDDVVAFVYVRFAWRGHTVTIPQPRIAGSRMYEVEYGASDEFPLGRRGMVMLRTWERLSEPDTFGMIVQDGDVLVDPYDYAVMLHYIHEDPKAVVTTPVKLWRANANGLTWHWAHWRDSASQEMVTDPDFFCFNFTYLPRQLLEACARRGMRNWAFPSVDTEMARVCRELGIRIAVAPTEPKHMNF